MTFEVAGRFGTGSLTNSPEQQFISVLSLI